MEYYYSTEINNNDSEITIRGQEFLHLKKVLRKKQGDKIIITDGMRNIYHSVIVSIEKDNLICKIEKREYNLFESEKNVTLYFAQLKNPDRLEFLIEKAVEIGVFRLQPIITDNTVNKTILSKTKLERYRKIIISAMKQSQRCRLPEIRNTITLKDTVNETKSGINNVIYYEFSTRDDEFKYNSASKDINILIGPEGGFSKTEVEYLRNKKWQFATLGERKLRAETAAIIGLYKLLKI